MKRDAKRWIMGAAVLLAGSGCSHGALDRDLDTKLSNQTPVTGQRELAKKAQTELGAQSKLTAEERRKLAELEDRTRRGLAAAREESLKLRAILIDDLSQGNARYNPSEVNLIKGRLTQTKDRRLALIFSAVDQANQILGHELDATENQKVFGYLYDVEGR